MKTIKVSTPVGVSVHNRASIAAKLENEEYRNAYLESMVTHGIAHQIRVNRELRGWSQKALGISFGAGKKQSTISRLEDPAYGKYSIQTLLDIAKAFDVALIVKFVPFSKFLTETSNKTPDALFAKSYSEEDLYLSVAQVTVYEDYLRIPSSSQPDEGINHVMSVFSLSNNSPEFIKKSRMQDIDMMPHFFVDRAEA